MVYSLKASVSFKDATGKDFPVIRHKQEAVDALTAEGYGIIEREIYRRIGEHAGGFGELVVCAAATAAIGQNLTADDIMRIKEEGKLISTINGWLNSIGVYITDEDGATSLIPEEKKPRRTKSKTADKKAIASDDIRVSSPTYGAIGGMNIAPAAKWLTDELIALFPSPTEEIGYNDITKQNITPAKSGNSITITAGQIGAYALTKYGKNTPQTREAIVKTLKEATKSVDIYYTNADGKNRQYVGSLFSIDAPHDGSTESIGGLQFPITLYASDVFKLYIKSRYGRISLQTQRQRLTDKGFGEYEAIKCWATSVAPYMAKEMQRRGSYSRTMSYGDIEGYKEAKKNTRTYIRQRAQTAAQAYANDYSTEDVTVTWSVDGAKGIQFSWKRVKK